MHQNTSHIYVGDGDRTLVWHAWWGGGGEPCMAESGGRGSRRRKSSVAEEKAGVEVVAEEIGVEQHRRWRRRPV
jgi:hypothetical protein